MSGGSYNYLCFAESREMTERLGDLEQMAERLESLGYRDAAKETLHVRYIIEHFLTRMECRLERLQGVWKSVEWHDSCDSGMDAVERAIAEYRGESHTETQP